jgi:hypothetical protein
MSRLRRWYIRVGPAAGLSTRTELLRYAGLLEVLTRTRM